MTNVLYKLNQREKNKFITKKFIPNTSKIIGYAPTPPLSPAPEQDLLFTVDTSLGAILEVQFNFGVVYNATIDWGDGSPTFSPSFGTVQKLYDVLAPSYGTFQVGAIGTLPQMSLSDNQNIISVENLGNVGLQDTGEMFRGCTNLASVNIGNYVTSIGDYAFRYCTSLTSIIIGNSVTSIGGYAFFGCTGLTNINIPNSVTSIGTFAFTDCNALTSATIGNSVTSIGSGAFCNCNSLTSATIGNSVTSIGGYAFAGCSSLTSITIPNSVTSIGQQAFDGCTVLATVDLSLPKSVIDAATDIFLGTASPLTLNVPTGTSGWIADSGLSIGGNTNVTVNLV